MRPLLIFPPLVSSNFGQYYPSTAVLDGFLTSAGFPSDQFDLNETFAEYLLQPVILQRVIENNCEWNFARVDHDATVTAARILLRQRHTLFDSQGRHDFCDRPGSAAYLLQIVAKHLELDLSLESLITRSDSPAEVTAAYEDFYEWCGVRARIEPQSLVGISVAMGPQLMPALVLSESIRRWAGPSCRIVLGGPVLSLMDDDGVAALLGTFTSVDAVVRFDGEVPLLALVQQHSQGFWAPETVNGVSSRSNASTTHVAPTATPPLDQMPFAIFSPTLVGTLSKPRLAVTQARGCYWGRCAYCDFVELYDGNVPYRTRSDDRVIDEIEHLSAVHHVSEFSIVTEAMPPAFARRFSERLIARRMDIRWHSFAMVHNGFTTALLRRMVEAGCEYLVIGLETMTDRVLALVEKAAREQENIAFLQACKAAGMQLRINLIPDLPTTTAKESRDALRSIRRLSDAITRIAVFPFEATRSSRIGADPARFGLVVGGIGSGTGQAQLSANHLNIHDHAMSEEERAEIHREYRNFAERLNRRPYRKIHLRPYRREQVFRVANEDLDHHVSATGSHVYFNWRLRQRIQTPPAVAFLLNCVQGSRFQFSDISQLLQNAAGARRLWHRLRNAGVIIPAMQEATSAEAVPIEHQGQSAQPQCR